VIAFLQVLLAASALGGGLWLILLAAKPVTARVFSRKWHYYTAIIPMVFLLGGAWIFAPMAARLSEAALPSVALSAEQSTPLVDEILISGMASDSISHAANFSEVALFTPSLVQNDPWLWTSEINRYALATSLFSLWIVGGLMFAQNRVREYHQFKRRLLETCRPAEYHSLGASYHLSKNCRTPMLVGFFRPIIILPEHEFSQDELEMILRHELMHKKRLDMPVKLLMLITTALHWFNPLVHYMSRQTAILCESACDEAVVREMNRNERIIYGKTILAVTNYGASTTTPQPHFSAGMCADGKRLKRRLKDMMKSTKKKVYVSILSVTLAALLTISGVFVNNIFFANTAQAGEGRGNSAGNIHAGGNVAMQGDWIYFVNTQLNLESRRHFDPDHVQLNGIFRMRQDGSGLEQITYRVAHSINVVGDWVYFLDRGHVSGLFALGISRVRTDGSALEDIVTAQTLGRNNLAIESMLIADGAIFYLNMGRANIYRVNFDGTGNTRVSNASVRHFDIQDGWIFYTDNVAGGHIYRMRTDGSEVSRVREGRSSFIALDGEWVYFLNDDEGRVLYRMNRNGENAQRLTDTRTADINILGDQIYFRNLSEGLATYRMNLDGTNMERVSEHTNNRYFHVVDGWIFYRRGANNFVRERTE